jgi:hypothetical protein
MLRIYKSFSYELNTLLDDVEKEGDRKYRWEAIGEAVEDAAFLESIGAPVEPRALKAPGPRKGLVASPSDLLLAHAAWIEADNGSG